MKFRKLVVTGTGRSGTRYASELFSRCGIPVSHQQVFSDNYNGEEPNWGDYVGDSSALAAPIQ